VLDLNSFGLKKNFPNRFLTPLKITLVVHVSPVLFCDQKLSKPGSIRTLSIRFFLIPVHKRVLKPDN